jgi:hypothetical protein
MKDAAPAGCEVLAAIGLYATAIVSVIAIAVYPVAWSRQKKRALEGSSQARGKERSYVAEVLHRTLLRRPQQRAIFHFIGQTIARNARYQVFLAIYAGIGLALALCSIVTLKVGAGGRLLPALSKPGLHAVLPLLLFWVVVGLKAAFAFPVDMAARWVFPINLPYPGLDAKAAKTWVLLCCGFITVAVLVLLISLGWRGAELEIQGLWGAGLSLVLADLFFVGRTQIPFTKPRMPGRASLPIIFTLYAALFPALVLMSVQMEMSAEKRWVQVVWIVIAIVGLHGILRVLDVLAQRGIIGGFPEDEEDEGPTVLGLFQ